MNAEEIRTAIEAGNRVLYGEAYEVIKDSKNQFLIKHLFGSHCIGLTWEDNTTLNGYPDQFKLASEAKRTYYVISTDGMNTFHTRKVSNPDEVKSILEEKALRPEWYLSVNDKGKLNVNPAAPLFIYGALTACLVVDEAKNILYSVWSGSEHESALNERYLRNFNPAA